MLHLCESERIRDERPDGRNDAIHYASSVLPSGHPPFEVRFLQPFPIHDHFSQLGRCQFLRVGLELLVDHPVDILIVLFEERDEGIGAEEVQSLATRFDQSIMVDGFPNRAVGIV